MSEYKQLEQDVNPKSTLDARNLHSPIPLLRLKKIIAELNSEDVVQVDCSDPYSGEDITSWCLRMKHKYLGEVRDFDYVSYFIMKK